MKRFFKFLGVLLLVATLSFALSVYVSKRNVSLSFLSGNAQEPGASTAPSPRKPLKLSEDEALSFFVVPGKAELRFYVPKTGEIKTIDLIKRAPAVRLTTLRSGARSISWSQDGSMVIADYADGAIKVSLTGGTTTKVPANILHPVISSFGQKVAYTFFDENKGTGSISTSDLDFKNFQDIIKTRYKNWLLQWVSRDTLAMSATKDPAQQTTVFLLDPHGPKLTLIVDGQRDVETLWSPDGAKVLYSQRTTRGTALFVQTIGAESTVSLATIGKASKCAWADADTLYCAVPKGGKMSITGSDDDISVIHLQNLEHPEKLALAEEIGFIDARTVTYAKAANALVYKNFKDGRLYEFSLAR